MYDKENIWFTIILICLEMVQEEKLKSIFILCKYLNSYLSKV